MSYLKSIKTLDMAASSAAMAMENSNDNNIEIKSYCDDDSEIPNLNLENIYYFFGHFYTDLNTIMTGTNTTMTGTNNTPPSTTIVTYMTFQVMYNTTHLFIVDVSLSRYIFFSFERILVQGQPIDSFIESNIERIKTTIKDKFYPDDKFKLDDIDVLIPQKPNEEVNDRWNYHINHINPKPNLPIIPGKKRYFIKQDYKDFTLYSKNNNNNNNNDLVNNSQEVLETLEEEYDEYLKFPDSFILCKNRKDKVWSYIQPVTHEIYHSLQHFAVEYIEISEDEYYANILRLYPRKIEDAELKKSLVTLIDIYNNNIIFNIIQTRFAEHNDFKEYDDKAKNSHVEFEEGDKGVVIKSLLNTGVESTRLFEVINFLRSYVDLYHDILQYGKEYCENLKAKYKKRLSGESLTYFNEWIDRIDRTIFTSTGNINQNKCKEIIEKLVDDFIITSKINLIPKTKEEALVMSISKDNPDEVASLIATLKADGVDGFFVESANNDIGQIFVSNGFNNVYNLTIGLWDAGSGFTGTTMKKKDLTTPPNIIYVGPTVPTEPTKTKGRKKNTITSNIINIDNYVSNMFGLYNIVVSPDNNQLTVVNSEDGTIIFGVTPRQTFSVNKILTTTNNVQVRGSGDVESGNIKTIGYGTDHTGKLIQIPFQIDPMSLPEIRAGLVSLKTWTDLIQIQTISKTMPLHIDGLKPLKVLTVIYDGLCETTARLYGLGHVLKTSDKIVSYYNYNIYSRQLDSTEKTTKRQVQTYINTNKKTFLAYLKLWFRQRAITLNKILKYTFDPLAFFVSKLYLNKYNIEYYKKAITLVDKIDKVELRQIPNTINEYIESISSSAQLLGDILNTKLAFENAIQRIELIGPRVDNSIFLDAYDYVEQQIINTFGNAEELELRAMIASTFAYVFLKSRKLSLFLFKIEEIKKALIQQKLLVPAPNIKRNFGIELTLAQNSYINTNLNKSLSQIKRHIPDADNVKKILRGISDIQIACQYLIKTKGYIPYITKQLDYSTITDQIIEAFAFSNIIQLVEQQIQAYITAGIYFGGKKLSRTYKRKQNKRKTYKKRK